MLAFFMYLPIYFPWGTDLPPIDSEYESVTFNQYPNINNSGEYKVIVNINDLDYNEYFIVKEEDSSSVVENMCSETREPEIPDKSESYTVSNNTPTSNVSIFSANCDRAVVKNLSSGMIVEVYGGENKSEVLKGYKDDSIIAELYGKIELRERLIKEYDVR